MASCTIRTRDESWIEVVLPAPTYAGELGKAHSIMLGQLGLEGAMTNDDVYEVVVGDDEIILRAKRPSSAGLSEPGVLGEEMKRMVEIHAESRGLVPPEVVRMAVQEYLTRQPDYVAPY